MMKCNECYYGRYADVCLLTKQIIPVEDCSRFKEICCDCESEAEVIYRGYHYCIDCVMEQFDLEESTTISYYKDGEFLGDSDDMHEVIENLSSEIEFI